MSEMKKNKKLKRKIFWNGPMGEYCPKTQFSCARNVAERRYNSITASVKAIIATLNVTAL